MIIGLESILLGTNDAKKLADFYKDTVGLKLEMEFEMGEDNEAGYGFDLGHKIGLVILDHSKVKGKNSLPDRIMFNLEVDNIEKEVAKLKKAKVKLVQDIYHVEDYGHIATFADPDGNYFQLVKTRA